MWEPVRIDARNSPIVWLKRIFNLEMSFNSNQEADVTFNQLSRKAPAQFQHAPVAVSLNAILNAAVWLSTFHFLQLLPSLLPCLFLWPIHLQPHFQSSNSPHLFKTCSIRWPLLLRALNSHSAPHIACQLVLANAAHDLEEREIN